jgi:hypothetical protein
LKELVFCLEEKSARVLIEGIVPRIASAVRVRYVVFEGKQDLEKQLVGKIRGYVNADARFIVVRDQDRSDCAEVKTKLVGLCKKAKKKATVRIACRTIEAFYLADLAAVEAALKIKGLAGKQRQARYRKPDQIQQPVEELAKLTKGSYQKVGGSRAIAGHLDLENQLSPSFHHLVQAIRAAI